MPDMSFRKPVLGEAGLPGVAPANPHSAFRIPHSGGFTLIELLTVIGIIAIFSGFVALRGGDKSQARDASVSTLSSLITSARGHAALKGTRAAVFVNANQNNPDRFQRYVVVCTENTTTGLWEPVDSGTTLPVGVYILSNTNPLPTVGPGLHKVSGVDWRRHSDFPRSELRSTALALTVTQAINSAVSEEWRGFRFTSRGTTGDSGAVIIANGRPLSGGAPASVLLENPDNVGGLKLSTYGTVTIVRQRQEF